MKHLRPMLLAAAVAIGPSCEQAPKTMAMPTTSTAKVYTYVEEMPQLPGSGGNAAICAAIQQGIHIPPFRGDYPEGSRVFVEFTVTATGTVCNVRIRRSIDSRVDTAVVRAVQALPRFTPGRQQGRLVSVKYTMPITFEWQ